MSRKQHSYIPVLQQQLAEGRIDRREFLRTATLLGVSAGAAYGFVGKLFGEAAIAPARADALPKGGTIRIAQRVKDITSPHAINWLEAANIFRQVAEYLTKTGTDNITRPYLLEGWEASDDLKTWTLHVRKGVKWHSGRVFTAEDVVWNFKHVLDESVGSSVIGLMTGYMLNT
jgi:peptide/nickel transport system substrate-binding protein